ncbi:MULTISPECIES: hypothetical protein [unclassified Haladaptatus]|uniref:DUF7563 family protein n=1 Tax=unclassified Haladaptatus TaxID=2622732 RepID=UPI0023E8675B|nr:MULTISPECIES: hypothetical protein [unclassified Haladaptatus]
MNGAAFEKTLCQNCGQAVTPQFRRVFGDNDDRVWACLDCVTVAAIHAGAAHGALEDH